MIATLTLSTHAFSCTQYSCILDGCDVNVIQSSLCHFFKNRMLKLHGKKKEENNTSRECDSSGGWGGGGGEGVDTWPMDYCHDLPT